MEDGLNVGFVDDGWEGNRDNEGGVSSLVEESHTWRWGLA
jgi:hypothetical protein